MEHMLSMLIFIFKKKYVYRFFMMKTKNEIFLSNYFFPRFRFTFLTRKRKTRFKYIHLKVYLT